MMSPKNLALAAGATALVLFTSPAFAQGDSYTPPADELEEAMAIMQVIFPPETREQDMLETSVTMGNQVAASMMTGPIFEEPGVRAIMDEFVDALPEIMAPLISKHLPAMIKSTAIAYTREFTLEELQDIRAFASTPTGARYFSSTQRVLSDPAVAESNQVFFGEVNEAQQVQLKALQRKIVDYLQANPDVAQRLQDQG